MNLDDLLDASRELLARSGADEWEVVASRGQEVSLAVRGEELDKFQESVTQGVAFRVIKDGHLGFTYLLGGEPADLKRAVGQALAAAEANDFRQETGFAAPGEVYPAVETHDPALAAEPLAAKRERALAMVHAARAADPRVVHVHPAEVAESRSRLRLVNSHGLDLAKESTTVSAGCVALAEEAGEQEVGYEGDARRFLADLNAPGLGAAAGRRAAAYLGGRPVADGRYDLVLENQVAAEFLELLSHSLLGDNLAKGRSLLTGRVGEEVISPRVSLVDDGLLPRGLGSVPFDGEGVPPRRKELVKDGVLRGFVFDRLWGAKAGLASTGNASRSGLKTPPGVGFGNLFIAPGAASRDGLLGELGRGLMLTEIMGGHTADPVSGQFSFGAAGFLVEGGVTTRPVKSMAVAGQVVELFRAVAGVGSDLRFFGRLGAPSLLVTGLSLSGPAA